MATEESPEARRLHSEEATKFENEVIKLVERWKYLLKLRWYIEVVAVRYIPAHTDLGPEDACIDITDRDNKKVLLEIVMLDRHPYVLEKRVVHELLHIPNMELQEIIEAEVTKQTKQKIQEVFATYNKKDEYRVDYWAETLVCLAHGLYAFWGAPPQDDFFNLNRRHPVNLENIEHNRAAGEYYFELYGIIPKISFTELKQKYEDSKMSGLL